MALLDALLPGQTPTVTTTAIDVVAVFRTDTLAQVFPTARPIGGANVYEVAETMEHPLEDGATVVDHIVYLPVEIELPLMITGDPASVYGEIRELFHAGELLTVQTRTGSYPNMLIRAIPHEERAETLTAVQISLQLREARFVETVYEGGIPPAKTPSAPARASTKKRGDQQTTTATPEQQDRGSVLYRVFGRKPK